VTLRVGLDLVHWTPDAGGSGTYARELILGLTRVAPQVAITGWVGRGAPDDIDELDVDWVRLPMRSTGSPVHVVYELAALGADARRRRVDVVHGLAYATPLLAPGLATVVTILDQTWLHEPTSVTRLARVMFRGLTATCGRAADRVIAISHTAAADLASTSRVPADRIDVTPLGVSQPAPWEGDGAAVRTSMGLPRHAPVVLAVGQLASHKNLGLLVDALAQLDDTHLVLVGRDSGARETLVARAARRGLSERVHVQGFVEDLEPYFAIAACVAVPSRHEGFGLVALEAMARGTPVACADHPALIETVGDAAVLFDAADPSSAAAAIQQVLADEVVRRDLVGRGLARARDCTWDRTALLTLDSYRRALQHA
jgi:glycosyltransferase involved in cell wall biosynthesis